MTTKLNLLFTILLLTLTLSRSRPNGPELPASEPISEGDNDKGQGSSGGSEPGTAFAPPDFHGGYGSDGGDIGGWDGKYRIGGVVRPTVVCKVKGPCYMKKLRCPAKCFKSFSRSGKGYGGGGGGGGCTIDCRNKCVAFC